MTTARRVLIVGSYPPIPIPAAAATLGAVRQAWADGDEVTVVSPRLSAAHLSVPVVGLLAGRRLANLQRHTSASRLVMVMEAGFPVPPIGAGGLAVRVLQWQTATGLVRAFAGFDRVTLIRVGRLDIAARVEARLAEAANEIIEQAGAPDAATPAVTALGPVETPPRERPRLIADQVGRRVLGRHAGPAKARIRSALGRSG